jgi:serine phosphatase RsbU (regulator of sigma subunit)
MRGRRAIFAAAGHPPAILISNGRARLLQSQNGILGCLSEIAPSESVDELELAPGDRLILYTDGLVEVFNTQHEMLGIEGFSQIVLEAANLALPEMRKAIIDGTAAWRHGPLADDVSLVLVEIR